MKENNVCSDTDGRHVIFNIFLVQIRKDQASLAWNKMLFEVMHLHYQGCWQHKYASKAINTRGLEMYSVNNQDSFLILAKVWTVWNVRQDNPGFAFIQGFPSPRKCLQKHIAWKHIDANPVLFCPPGTHINWCASLAHHHSICCGHATPLPSQSTYCLWSPKVQHEQTQETKCKWDWNVLVALFVYFYWWLELPRRTIRSCRMQQGNAIILNFLKCIWTMLEAIRTNT